MKKLIIAIAMLSLFVPFINGQQENKKEMNNVSITENSQKGIPGIGNKVICPVTQEEFFITEKTPKIEYEGKTYYFCCEGCIEKFKKEPQKYISNTDLKIGNKVICPVMGTKFIPNSKSPKAEYKGKAYYFCCSECIEKFNKEPEKYINKPSKKKCCDDKNKKTHNHKHEKGKMCNMCDENKSDNKSQTESKKTFTMDEISKHNKKGDCWLVINSKVYDVSEFSKKHNEKILLGCGKDATKLFETRTDENGNKIGSGRPHSENARKIRDKFYIGELAK